MPLLHFADETNSTNLLFNDSLNSKVVRSISTHSVEFFKFSARVVVNVSLDHSYYVPQSLLRELFHYFPLQMSNSTSLLFNEYYSVIIEEQLVECLCIVL